MSCFFVAACRTPYNTEEGLYGMLTKELKIQGCYSKQAGQAKRECPIHEVQVLQNNRISIWYEMCTIDTDLSYFFNWNEYWFLIE
jgi:hypothetical protein